MFAGSHFTPLKAVLFTFPSRYWFTIGCQLVFSLAARSPRIHAGIHVHCITQVPFWSIALSATRLSRSMAGFSTPFAQSSMLRCKRSYNPPADAGVWTVPLSLAATHGIDNFFLFLRLLRCFTWPGMARLRVCTDAGVTPFGHLRINACYPLPEAFRSLLRPSSPAGT